LKKVSQKGLQIIFLRPKGIGDISYYFVLKARRSSCL